MWASPAGPGLYGSVLFRLAAPLPPERVGWLTLLGGMAVVDVASEVAGVGGVTVKWPNDVLAGGAKLAGVLAEAVPSAHGLAVVLGIGVNVRPLPNDPEPGAGGLPATSFVDEAASVTDLTDLAGELYERLDGLYQRWQEAGGDAVGTGLHAEYCARCATIGARVRVEMPDESITGAARDIDVDGRLVLQLSSGDTRVVSAGDVVHLRTEPTRYRGGETTDR